MSRQEYNNRIITQYLLGSLPEAEAERFDELSFTDDEFADALKAAEKDLVDAYAQGELAGAELERFKSFYLASPLRREKADFARALRLLAEKGAAAEARAETLGETATKRQGSGVFSALRSLFSPRPALRLGAALAALVLLAAGVWLAFENARLRGQTSQTQSELEAAVRREQEMRKELEGRRSAGAQDAQELARARAERELLEGELKRQEAQGQQSAGRQRRVPSRQMPTTTGGVSIASFVLTPQMRSAGQIQTVSVPAETDYVAMRLELEPHDYPNYGVTLLDRSGNLVLWRSGRLKARAAGDARSLDVSFRAGLLRPQAYLLRVEGVSADGITEIVGDYPFRVVK